MPVQKCTTKGKSGYKYGKSGKCYTGSGAKKRAHVQGYAIKKSQQRRGKPTK